jgi:hypothetical protein
VGIGRVSIAALAAIDRPLPVAPKECKRLGGSLALPASRLSPAASGTQRVQGPGKPICHCHPAAVAHRGVTVEHRSGRIASRTRNWTTGAIRSLDGGHECAPPVSRLDEGLYRD